MKTLLGALTALALLPTIALAQDLNQEPGVLGSPPPEDIYLEVTTGENGAPVASQTEFRLAVGGYYRFNFVCPDAEDDTTGFHFESPGLLENAHLRVVSVSDIEIYMQGLSFHAIECDEAGSARFSFHPMRTGTYDLLVRDHSEPPQQVLGQFIVE